MRLNVRRRESLAGYLFIAPTYLFYIVFLLLPLCATIYYSFTEYNVIQAPQWIGLENYAFLFKDRLLPGVVKNTLIYTVLTTIFKTLLSLALAIGLNSSKLFAPVRSVARAAIFFPYVVAMSYVALIWSFMFSKDMGLVNFYLNRFGLASVSWFTDMKLALYMLIALDVWKNCGYGMLVFLAGMQGISKDFYEAAEIDGASRWDSIRHITLPLLRPMLVMMVMLNTIFGMQAFDSMSVITGGGPGNSTRSILMHIYEKAFENYNMGYASALSLAFVAVILVISLLQLKLDKSSTDK